MKSNSNPIDDAYRVARLCETVLDVFAKAGKGGREIFQNNVGVPIVTRNSKSWII